MSSCNINNLIDSIFVVNKIYSISCIQTQSFKSYHILNYFLSKNLCFGELILSTNLMNLTVLVLVLPDTMVY